jgi:hypothetical protein
MRKTLHRRKRRGLGTRAEDSRRRVFVTACAAVDHIAYHSKTPTYQLVEEWHGLRAHCDRRLVEILADAATGEPRKHRGK